VSTATEAPRWTVKRPDSNVTTVKLESDTRTWEQSFLLRSDVHRDNPHCRRDLEKRHLDEAVARGAGILDFGDLFDAMQGKDDRRASKSELRDEYKSSDYLDKLVSENAKHYTPYAQQFVLIGRGNHETAVLNRHETDLTERLVGSLNTAAGSHIVSGGYTGWVVFLIRRGQHRVRRVLWYTHGYGGGGPVTMDVIQASRQTQYLEGVDYTVSGHTHDAWHLRRERIRVNAAGKIERRTLHQLKAGCYKDDYGDGSAGWNIEKGHPPKPIGAWWLRLWWDGDRLRESFTFAD
jgi:hypothetical protein